MGYIKFKKAATTNGGSADLLPAEGILHVGVPTSTTVAITYASAKAAGDVATVTYPTQSDFSTIRDAINNAIELANGASGPAVSVDMVDITSIATT
jgi:predicted SAM-dependent methyltransferase